MLLRGRKRIKKELLLLDERNIEYSLQNEYNPNKPLYLYTKVNNHDIKIIIGREFPFQSPTVYILENNIQYHYDFYFLDKYSYFKHYNIAKSYLCPCCYNKCCNWEICTNIYEIIDEIVDYQTKTNDYISILCGILTLLRFNISKDIIKIIIKYI